MPPRPPRYRITWWMRLRFKIRTLRTPLGLRDSIKRLQHTHSHPYFTLLKLFIIHIQMPSWNWSYNYPLPKLLAPKDIADNEALFNRHHPYISDLRYIPIWTIRDTPLRAIYRLYEILMTREFVLLRRECEYIWKRPGRKWSLYSIPDPCDPDPIRYAILASIVEELVKAFNWRLQHGQRRTGENITRSIEVPWPKFDPEITPSWTALVPPIKTKNLCELPSNIVKDGQLVLADGGCENFTRRNFDADTRYLYTT